MLRIDTHHHAIPSFYRKLMVDKLIGESGGRLFPQWSAETSLATMGELNIGSDAAALARDINDYLADLGKNQPDRFDWSTLGDGQSRAFCQDSTRSASSGPLSSWMK